MLFTKHVINPNKVAKPSDLAGAYAIGLTVDKFLDLFSDVKSFEANGSSIIDSSISASYASSDIIGSLSNLNSLNNGNDISSFVGSSRRKILPVGVLQASGEDQVPSKVPNALVDYPVHSMGSSGGLVIIDFGKTLCYADLLFPHITIQFSTGMGNLASGIIVGFFSFENYGSIPIYGGPRVDGINLGFASGSISVKERYSDLRADYLVARAGTEVSFVSKKPLINLESYKTAYFGSIRGVARATATSITVSIPPNAKSGPIRFESDSPQFDSFLSYDEIIVTS